MFCDCGGVVAIMCFRQTTGRKDGMTEPQSPSKLRQLNNEKVSSLINTSACDSGWQGCTEGPQRPIRERIWVGGPYNCLNSHLNVYLEYGVVAVVIAICIDLTKTGRLHK